MERLRWMVFVGGLLVALRVFAAGIPGDCTGEYEGGSTKDGTLTLMEGDRELSLSYLATFGNAHICDCLVVLRATAGGVNRHYVAQSSDGAQFIVDINPTQIKLGGDFRGCCGAGWPGDTFHRSQDLKAQATSCTVKSARAHFFGPEENGGARIEPTARYVVAKDTVDAVNGAYATWNSTYMFGRFRGKKTVIGLLKKADLACIEH